MYVETFPVAPLGCNCTVAADLESHEAIVIDPGGDFDVIQARLAQRDLKVRAILHTHTHFDHVGATAALQRGTTAPARIHEADLFLYQILPIQSELFGVRAPTAAELDTFLTHDEVIRAGTVSCHVIHTPGHTPGSCCFELKGADGTGVLLAGDTLFRRGVGRTDLWGGDQDALMKSIRHRLLTLPEDLRVVCGHGADTTIGQEKRSNPYLRG